MNRSDSRTTKFIKNTVSTGVYQAAVVLTGFLIPRILLTCYGSEVNGLVSSVTQFVSYFNLVEAGLSAAAVYSLYKPLAEKKQQDVSAIVTAARNFYLQAGWIFISLVALLAVVYPLLIRTTALSSVSIGLLVLIIGVNSALEFFTLAKYRALLTADQKTYVISWASFVYQVLNTLIIYLLAKHGLGIVLVRFAAIFALIVRTAILILYVRKDYPYLDYSAKPNKSALSKKWDALYLQILGVIHTGAPTILLTIICKDLKVVSVYAIFNMVMQGLNSLLSIFIGSLSASFGDVIARNQKSVLQTSYNQFELAYYALITVVYSVAFIMIMPFIRLYTLNVTDTVYNVPLYGFLFTLNGLLYSLKNPQGMLVISAGLYKETKTQVTIQGGIAVVGGIVLGYYYGITGVMIASIASNLYRDVDLLFFIPKFVTDLPVKNTLLRWSRILLELTLIIVPSFFFKATISGYLEWAGVAAAWCLYAGLIVLAISMIYDRSAFQDLKRRIFATTGGKQ